MGNPGEGTFCKKPPPPDLPNGSLPIRKNFDWWGGGVAGVPLTGRLKGKALSEDVVAPSSRHGENTAFFQFFRWRASWLRQSVIPLER